MVSFEIEDNKPDIGSFELVVSGTIPAINSNFDVLKTAIENRLKDYEIEVTEENLSQAKKDSTELSKAIKQLQTAQKERMKSFQEPIEQFKNQILELVEMIQDGQKKIKDQVAKFEQKKINICIEKMNTLLGELWNQQEVKPLYRTASISNMAGISKIDKKGELTKAAKEQVLAIVIQNRQTQDRNEGRLAKLKADSLEAGLKLPLQASAVWSFIDSTDEEYETKLKGAIENELSRQEKLLELEQKKLEEAAKKACEKERERLAEHEQIIAEKKEIEIKKEEVQTEKNKDSNQYSVIVQFDINSTKPYNRDAVLKFFSTELAKTRLPAFTIEIKK